MCFQLLLLNQCKPCLLNKCLKLSLEIPGGLSSNLNKLLLKCISLISTFINYIQIIPKEVCFNSTCKPVFLKIDFVSKQLCSPTKAEKVHWLGTGMRGGENTFSVTSRKQNHVTTRLI